MKRKPTKQAAPMNVSPAIRAELAMHGGFELDALLGHIRDEVSKITVPEAFAQLVAI